MPLPTAPPGYVDALLGRRVAAAVVNAALLGMIWLAMMLVSVPFLGSHHTPPRDMVVGFCIHQLLAIGGWLWFYNSERYGGTAGERLAGVERPTPEGQRINGAEWTLRCWPMFVAAAYFIEIILLAQSGPGSGPGGLATATS